jgi:NADPH:quinone reductase-like Zn-dependent oxidoreductase
MQKFAVLLTTFFAASAVVGHAQESTMKAIRFHEFGPVSVLKYEDAPRPSPAAGEVLVKVAAAGVNPVDAKVRDGSFKRGDEKLPMIPGYDIAGVVEEVGEGVTKFKKGDAVYAYLSLMRAGAYAQYAIAKENELALKPKSISNEEAAAVPLAALTAWQALIQTAKLETGQSVLVHGGSGGVGHFAVQLAKARGAKVSATASDKNQAFLKELGVDQPVDYRATRFEDVVKDVDIVLDTVAGETLARSYDVVKKGGIVVSILDQPNPIELAKRGIRGEVILVRPNGEQLAEIATLIEAGKIKPTISMTMPLAEAAKAHEQIETGHTRGKIVLKVE